MAVARVPVEPPRQSPIPPVVAIDALPMAEIAPPASTTPPPRVLKARVVAALLPPVLSPVVPLAAEPVRAESPWSDPVVPVPVPLPEALPAIEPVERLEPRRRSKRAPVIAAASADEEPDDAALAVEAPRRHRRRVAKGPKLVPPGVYLPDQRHVTQVKWLAAMLGAVVLFSLLPLLTKMHLNPATAPGWARVVLLLAALQAVYVAWMFAAPDWASVWVVMLVFALAATIYGAATAVAIATPAGKPLLLGLDAVRLGARSWCGAVLAVMTLATYLCGRTSARWRRDCQRQLAARSA
jgi:hypothetical protein